MGMLLSKTKPKKLVIARRDTAAVLEAADELLDAVAHGVDGVIDGVLDQAVAFGRDFRLATTATHIVADRVAVIAAITEQNVGIAVPLGHEIGIGGTVMRLAGRQDNADRQAVSVGTNVDFGREATARAV